MRLFKKFLNLSLFVVIMAVAFNYKDISYYVVGNYIYNKNVTIEINKGEYSRNKDYDFIQITDDFVANDYQDLLNIFYTILDSGNNSYSFYCDSDYKNCMDDIQKLNSGDDLSHINNFVHPYYAYKNISIATNNFGKITVTLEKQYTNEQIDYINKELERISAITSKDQKTNKDKILAFHDYVVVNSKYDSERANNMDSAKYKDSQSHTAYGLLKDKLALCGGYSDIMAIYIDTLGIDNIRISGNNHIWNLVNIDGWKHLDATWDDPLTNTGEEILLHDYFLITTEQLKEYDAIIHEYDKEVYKEAN